MPPPPKRSAAKRRDDDAVLSPQPEMPRDGLGTDRSRSRSSPRELSWAQFDGMVQGLARAIRRTFRPEVVVGVAHGGVFVGGALASALAAEFHPVRISRRSRENRTRKQPRLSGTVPRRVKGRRVLVVDDVAASGETLTLAQSLATKAGARDVRTASLICRAEGYAPDWTALTTAELVVFPWDYQPVNEDGRFDVDPDKAGA